ncbi:hypothetical protein E4U55_004992 [Claviceps digitariae]|nr:hypothetical protein E4U55_004992 [Claviceps digitariae]
MKFTTILSGLALSALEVSASAVEEGSSGLQERGPYGYCCAKFEGKVWTHSVDWDFWDYIDRGNLYIDYTVPMNGCKIHITKPDLDGCTGWKFDIDRTCLDWPKITANVVEAAECQAVGAPFYSGRTSAGGS